MRRLQSETFSIPENLMAFAPHEAVPLHILVAEEDAAVRRVCSELVSAQGHVPHESELSGRDRSFLLSQGVDVVLVDERVATGGGAALLEELRHLRPDVAVVWMSSATSAERTMCALRYGAADVLIKPFGPDELSSALQRVAERRTVDAAARAVRERLRSGCGIGNIIGQSPEMEKLFRIVARVAQSAHPVLILGETGTGKELVARAIHANGPGGGKPFVPVDCGSLAPSLIESELFGHVKGAFTGAHRASEGLLVAAGSGTVFLDEIAELPLDLQSRLLRALQEKEVRPLGGTHTVPLRARVLAATHQDLMGMVEQGKFRRDLYFRLNVVKLRLPALRERMEDVPLLIAYFLDRNSREMRRKFRLSAEALAFAAQYPWPGNVRELGNAMDRACSTSSADMIQIGDLTTCISDAWGHAAVMAKATLQSAAEIPQVRTLAEMEKDAILDTLKQVNGDKLLAARLLDIGKTTLYRKLKEYGVNP